jgi:hypothetical protein
MARVGFEVRSDSATGKTQCVDRPFSGVVATILVACGLILPDTIGVTWPDCCRLGR